MGRTHARAFAKLPDVQVVGIYSRSVDKATELAQEVGGEPFGDAMALATHAQVDAVSNTLPTHLHAEYTLAALKAGKPVLLEKPMGLTVEECDAMIDAARQSGQILMLAHVLRFWPEYMALVDLVKSGELGRPLAATASRLSARPAWGDWFANPAWTGGAVHDLHIHDLDTLNWLFGTPKSVYARGQRGAPGGWDHVLTLVDYGPVQGFAEGSVMMPDGYPFTMTLWVLCEKGSVEFTFRAGGSGVETGSAGGTSLVVYEAAEVAYFVQCVQEKRPPERGTAEDGRLAVQTALAARQSLETNQVVFL
jgi:predicted dehydrogenase